MATEIVAALIGVAGGLAVLLFTWWKDAHDRTHRVAGSRAALRAEIEACHARARTYQTDSVMSPLYRLPTRVYETAFPALLADDALTGEQVTALSEFYSEVETLNRGLDEADRVRAGAVPAGQSPEAALRDAYSRNLIKAKHLTDTHYGAAVAAVTAG